MSEENWGPSPLTQLPLCDGQLPAWWNQELWGLMTKWPHPNVFCTWKELWDNLALDVLFCGRAYLYHNDEYTCRLSPMDLGIHLDKDGKVLGHSHLGVEVTQGIVLLVENPNPSYDIPVMVDAKP